MRRALTVVAGIIVIIAIAIAPDLYLNRGLESHYRYEGHASGEATNPGAGNSNPRAQSAPATHNVPEGNPRTEDRSTKKNELQMKWTDILLIFVGFLQFGAIVGQLIIYGRQTKIMGKQAATVKLANQTARRVADTLPRIERAYISALGFAKRGTIQDLGSGRQSLTEYAGSPNLIELVVNNYGKTPGKLIDVRAGFIDGSIPEEPPPFTENQVFYMNYWLKPDTIAHGVRYIAIPDQMQKPIIYGRVYYRDILVDKLHSTGFVLGISSGGTEPIRAPSAYSDDRDEHSEHPPMPLPAPLPERRHEVPRPATITLRPPL